MKDRILVLLGVFCSIGLWGQCDLEITGKVYDRSTGIPLEFASIFIEPLGAGTVSDSLGQFQLIDLCAGKYHVQVSHLGCEDETFFLQLERDTFLSFMLSHHAELLDEVVIHEEGENTTESSSTLGKEAIQSRASEDLATLLSSLPGISSLRNGSSISKPVIHGLFGNRVAILNNGLVQAGQQWGNDHAPEIDPFVADHISVIKGAASLQNGGNSLGSVVLIEADEQPTDPHLHGASQYTFLSNGLGHIANVQLEQKQEWAAWRLSGTFKRLGDRHTPDYFLQNTGNREANFAAQLFRDFNARWKNEAYYSFFSAEIGVLRGSHIGNTTDLQFALNQDVPFFTEPDFSYGIDAPKQRVEHHLLKLKSRYFISESQVLQFKYGAQINRRREFDVRRSGRSDIPAMSIFQWHHTFDVNYQHSFGDGWFWKSGLQEVIVDNDNNPETGILPLIPTYRSFQSSLFSLLQKESGSWFYELGARYDHRYYKVLNITRTVPRMVERNEHFYNNFSLSAGAKYRIGSKAETSLNAGYVLRAPEVNELYSFGLHQGVSGIEEGDPNLEQERSLKVVWTNNVQWGDRLFVQALAYYQRIDDFIFLEPQAEFRLTIRGAFPVFIYQQTDADLYGVDASLVYEPLPYLKASVQYAMVRGTDRINNNPLIFMPADNIRGALTYSWAGGERWKDARFSVRPQYVWEQTRFNEGQDFLPPPDDYFLLGLQGQIVRSLGEQQLRFSVRVNNLLNERYRDYLNRLRYFADEAGRDVQVSVAWKF